MNQARRFALALFAAGFAFPAIAGAIAQRYVDWAEGPAQHLFTDADRAAWAATADDAAAERFVRLFWLRRDPTPDTPDNEFRRDFERRVAMANQSFGETLDKVVTPGWKTDRGRTLILLGPPKRRQKGGSAGEASGGDTGVSAAPSGSVASGTGPGQFGTGGNQDRFGGASEESWIYEDENKPEWIKKKRFTVKFRSVPGKPIVKLHNSEEALAFMAESRERSIVSPNLDEKALATSAAPGVAGELRSFGVTSAKDGPAFAALRASLHPGFAPSASAALETGSFQASDGTWIVPFHLAVTAAPPAGSSLVGELVDASGAIESLFEVSGPWKSAAGQSYLQGTLAPPPGEHVLRLGVRDGIGAILWSSATSVAVPEAEAKFWISELLLAEQIAPLPKAQEMLQPFAWQGIEVVPDADHRFAQGGPLWLYLHACDVPLDAAGKPQFAAKVEVSGPARFQGAIRGEPVKAGDRCWVVAQAFDLTAGAFPVGDYRVEVKVTPTGGEPLAASAGFTVSAAGG